MSPVILTERQKVIHNVVHKVVAEHYRVKTTPGEASLHSKVVTLLLQYLPESPNPFEALDLEVPVAGGLRERFDFVDRVERTVYELKVSAKNPGHEFFKDVFKVLAHNRNAPVHRIQHFVFMVPKNGAAVLKRGLGQAVTEMGASFGFTISVWDISTPIEIVGG
jgi:hypothetical protein